MKKIFTLFSIFVLVGLISLPVCASSKDVEKLLIDFPGPEFHKQAIRIADEFNGKTIEEGFSVERENGNIIIQYDDNQFQVINKEENKIVTFTAQILDNKLIISNLGHSKIADYKLFTDNFTKKFLIVLIVITIVLCTITFIFKKK